MTPTERQTVIQALELLQEYMLAYDWRDIADYENAQTALAIMRREQEQAKSDADSYAERQAIAERNRAVVGLVQDDPLRKG